MRRAWLLAAAACAPSPPPPVAPVEVAAPSASVEAPPRPSMLSGTPARAQVKTGQDAPLDPCTTASGESDGVRVTTVECNAFDGASAFAWGPDAYAGIYSQSHALLATFPRGGAPRLERLPFWAAVSISPRSDGLDVASSYEWQSLVRGAWTRIAQLPNGISALAWVWEGAGPRIWARTGGTLGTAIEIFRWVNGAWTRTPFWPSPARKGPPPAVLDATRVGDALFFTYMPTYDGAGGLFIEPEGGAPVHALTSVAPRTTSHPSLALPARETWPLVALKSGDDLIVATPAVTASGVTYTQGVIPGAAFTALARTPPARSDREPVMRDGVAQCSEAVDNVSSDRLFSPVLVTRSNRALLLFVRHHVERRHRWTLIPARARSFCDWLEERAVETTEVVIAELVRGPTPSARELLAIPIRARVFDVVQPRLAAASVGDTLDVLVATGPVLEHVTIDARRLP